MPSVTKVHWYSCRNRRQVAARIQSECPIPGDALWVVGALPVLPLEPAFPWCPSFKVVGECSLSANRREGGIGFDEQMLDNFLKTTLYSHTPRIRLNRSEFTVHNNRNANVSNITNRISVTACGFRTRQFVTLSCRAKSLAACCGLVPPPNAETSVLNSCLLTP